LRKVQKCHFFKVQKLIFTKFDFENLFTVLYPAEACLFLEVAFLCPFVEEESCQVEEVHLCPFVEEGSFQEASFQVEEVHLCPYQVAYLEACPLEEEPFPLEAFLCLVLEAYPFQVEEVHLCPFQEASFLEEVLLEGIDLDLEALLVVVVLLIEVAFVEVQVHQLLSLNHQVLEAHLTLAFHSAQEALQFLFQLEHLFQVQLLMLVLLSCECLQQVEVLQQKEK